MEKILAKVNDLGNGKISIDIPEELVIEGKPKTYKSDKEEDIYTLRARILEDYPGMQFGRLRKRLTPKQIAAANAEALEAAKAEYEALGTYAGNMVTFINYLEEEVTGYANSVSIEDKKPPHKAYLRVSGLDGFKYQVRLKTQGLRINEEANAERQAELAALEAAKAAKIAAKEAEKQERHERALMEARQRREENRQRKIAERQERRAASIEKAKARRAEVLAARAAKEAPG